MYTCTTVCASLTVSLKQCTQNSFMSCPQSNVQCSATTLRVDRKNMYTCIIHAQSMYSISPKYIMAYPTVTVGARRACLPLIGVQWLLPICVACGKEVLQHFTKRVPLYQSSTPALTFALLLLCNNSSAKVEACVQTTSILRLGYLSAKLSAGCTSLTISCHWQNVCKCIAHCTVVALLCCLGILPHILVSVEVSITRESLYAFLQWLLLATPVGF